MNNKNFRLANKLISQVVHPNWMDSTENTDAGYGILVVIAYIEGNLEMNARPIAKYFGLEDHRVIKPALERLHYSGIFSPRYDLKSELDFLLPDGIYNNPNWSFSSDTVAIDDWTLHESVRNAWCQIAGVASGVLVKSF